MVSHRTVVLYSMELRLRSSVMEEAVMVERWWLTRLRSSPWCGCRKSKWWTSVSCTQREERSTPYMIQYTINLFFQCCTWYIYLYNLIKLNSTGCFLFSCNPHHSTLSFTNFTTPDLDITAGSKTHFTTRFWTDSGIPVVMWDWHHYRFLWTDSDVFFKKSKKQAKK